MATRLFRSDNAGRSFFPVSAPILPSARAGKALPVRALTFLSPRTASRSSVPCLSANRCWSQTTAPGPGIGSASAPPARSGRWPVVTARPMRSF
jgi:hypothetical protein